MSAIESLLGHFDASTIQGLSAQLGATPRQMTTAIQASLPLLMGAMQRNASQEGGTDALFLAVTRDHQQADLGALFAAFVSAGSRSAAATALKKEAAASAAGKAATRTPIQEGTAILKHIFGNLQTRAADGVARASGLETAAAAKLLAMLALLLLSAFGRATKQRGLDARRLVNLLGHDLERLSGERPGAVREMLGKVLYDDLKTKGASTDGREPFGAFIRR